MPLTLEDLEYEAVHGEGGFAIVKRYRARDDGQKIAVKQLRAGDADSRRRFLREIELLRALQPHSNIVPLLGVSESPDTLCFMMPLAPYNLEQYLATQNAHLIQSQRIAIFRQVCLAMIHAHERGVLHRDLAPRNVLLFPPNDSPGVCVADFGLGRDLSSTSSRGGSVGLAAGHAAYIAPEQHVDFSQATTRSDVYALGRLLKFVLTGRHPDALERSPFAHVVATATQHDPSRRYENASALLRALDEFVALETTEQGAFDLETLSAASPPVDWRVILEAAIAGTYGGHVYYGYLGPLTSYLSVAGRLDEFRKQADSQFVEFVRKYVEHMEVCLVLTGWPFGAMRGFGHLLYEIAAPTQSADVRSAACVGLWTLAYDYDQWSAQDQIKALLRAQVIDDATDEALAARIIASNRHPGLSGFAGFSVPAKMKAALQR